MKRKGIRITLVLIAIVAVVGGIAVSKIKENKNTVLVVQPSLTITQAPTPTTVTSDSQLEKDTQGIDTQMKALNTDAANIDQSLNDQQGNLSEQ